MPKIYKYFSPDVIKLIFQRKGCCGIKCSFPKDYNDPYELFLGMDLNVPTEFLATYSDIVQELPQYPTTCFSKSPIVSPMWAHYAKDHSGFVLEFDTEELINYFKDSLIDEVSYKDEPNEELVDLLAKACVAGKPRHVVWLLQAVIHEAYFSKYTHWSYEQESRFVDVKSHTENVGDNKILFVPASCVTAIIIGNKFPSDRINFSVESADVLGWDWYKLNIGRSYPAPYMNDRSGKIFTFREGEILLAESVCSSCLEPLFKRKDMCPWCSITEAHKLEAAQGNPFRMLDHYGILDRYLEEVSKIGRK